MILKINKNTIVNTSNVISIYKDENNITIRMLDIQESELKTKCSFNKLKKLLKDEFILLSDILLLNKKFISKIEGASQVYISTSIQIENLSDTEHDIIYEPYPANIIQKQIYINELK